MNSKKYYEFFPKDKREKALERAWQNRDFEIDKYWSRATYFWAFTAAAFAGYIALLSAETVNIDKASPHLQFIITCIGLIFSVAWTLVNYGSKKWQENWEKHIDMLEDDITGPLYKTVLKQNTFSVSRINILVSYFISGIWLVLAIQYLITKNMFCSCNSKCEPVGIIWVSITFTLVMLSLMIFGYGRTTGKSREFRFFLREQKNLD